MEFKLYLYGIEIWVVKSSKPLGHGSNCTFMELKWEIGKPETKDTAFKLYLYGIEILVRNCNIRQLIRFKLYLYGIEMSSAVKRLMMVVRSNCTFMELKFCLGSCNCKSTSVQIVPLWN